VDSRAENETKRGPKETLGCEQKAGKRIEKRDFQIRGDVNASDEV
jgi:hypothetical protein